MAYPVTQHPPKKEQPPLPPQQQDSGPPPAPEQPMPYPPGGYQQQPGGYQPPPPGYAQPNQPYPPQGDGGYPPGGQPFPPQAQPMQQYPPQPQGQQYPSQAQPQPMMVPPSQQMQQHPQPVQVQYYTNGQPVYYDSSGKAIPYNTGGPAVLVSPMVVVPAAAPHVPPPEKTNWTTGVFSCFEDVGSCCEVFWCSSCQSSSQWNRANNGKQGCEPLVCLAVCGADWCLMGIGTPIVAILLRQRLRQRYNLEGSDCKDIMCGCCCAKCVLCQNYREMCVRGEHPGGVMCTSTPYAGPRRRSSESRSVH